MAGPYLNLFTFLSPTLPIIPFQPFHSWMNEWVSEWLIKKSSLTQCSPCAHLLSGDTGCHTRRRGLVERNAASTPGVCNCSLLRSILSWLLEPERTLRWARPLFFLNYPIMRSPFPSQLSFSPSAIDWGESLKVVLIRLLQVSKHWLIFPFHKERTSVAQNLGRKQHLDTSQQQCFVFIILLFTVPFYVGWMIIFSHLHSDLKSPLSMHAFMGERRVNWKKKYCIKRASESCRYRKAHAGMEICWGSPPPFLQIERRFRKGPWVSRDHLLDPAGSVLPALLCHACISKSSVYIYFISSKGNGQPKTFVAGKGLGAWGHPGRLCFGFPSSKQASYALGGSASWWLHWFLIAWAELGEKQTNRITQCRGPVGAYKTQH